MNSNDPKEKKELSADELAKIAGGAIQQPRNDTAQPNPDPLITSGTPTSTLNDAGLGSLPESLTEE
jgi:bacteriocin-like protein